MKRVADPQSLGTRLMLSYLAASLAAALTGMLALFLTPAMHYDRLMMNIMHPPAGATAAQMDAELASAISSTVLMHVLISLAMVIGIGLVFSFFLSSAIGQALGRVMDATRRLAAGEYSERVAERGASEFTELAHNVNLLAASLEESRRVRTLATASVSHELRTPVTALRGYCDALHDGVLPWSDEVLARMDRAVDRLERMAADLSALSRAEGNAYADLELKPLAAAAVIQAVADAVRPSFEDVGVKLVVDPVSPALRVLADQVRVGEILENLLINSAGHTPAGRKVTLSATQTGNRVEFRVQDEGTGIRKEDLPHVTEPFFRGEGGSAGHTSRPGMGLGLAISRRLAEVMNGSLALSSPGSGFGTLARLTLPQA
ncbi:MAG: HAMP domain-containing sensor histidine kinase [Thermaerobacter sp.]|nr:HAMP domain-containing sensor histidine kinase [Thermaerobacter sp.]